MLVLIGSDTKINKINTANGYFMDNLAAKNR